VVALFEIMKTGGAMRRLSFLVILILVIAILVSCVVDVENETEQSDSDLKEFDITSPLNSENYEEDFENGSMWRLSLADQIEVIIERHLIGDLELELGISDKNIELHIVLGISAEGASFLPIFDEHGRLEFLAVDIFGKMGRISHSLTCTEHLIVYSITDIRYSEPIFINPMIP
jgi:hypothetical protein